MSHESAKYQTKAPKPLYVGIDPGVNTGCVVWDSPNQWFMIFHTTTITKAMNYIMIHREFIALVRIEDARQRNWFGKSGREVLQGAGSIKRDCSIWETFCQENNIPYEMVAPRKNKTKTTASYFKSLTKYKGRTSEHSRDAALLVYGF